jgi:hypothetical protein
VNTLCAIPRGEKIINPAKANALTVLIVDPFF